MTVWSYRALHRTTRSAPTGRCPGQRAACGCGLPITTVFISYAGLRQPPGPPRCPAASAQRDDRAKVLLSVGGRARREHVRKMTVVKHSEARGFSEKPAATAS